MNKLSDIITYIRRIIKSPSDAVITDNLIIDYINRFYLMDVDARIQLFDLKTTYSFETSPGVDKYNMPLYSVQTEPGNQSIAMFPVYQGFTGPTYVNGFQVSFQTQKDLFFRGSFNVAQQINVVATGDGTRGPYRIQLPILPGILPTPINPPINGILRGHVDIRGIIGTNNNIDPPLADNLTFSNILASIPVTSIEPAFYLTSLDSEGKNVIVSDSGIFFDTNINHGMLINPGKAPYGNTPLTALVGDDYSLTSNTVNYLTGEVNVTFPVAIPVNQNINVQCYYFQSGLPRAILFYNNVLTLRSPPDTQYLVQLDAYLSPAAFLSTGETVPFGYMAEYLARGAARKILSDTGDIEQFQFYEPLFREQEMLVWKRSQRQFTSTRTETIYSQGTYNGAGWSNNFGGSVL